MSGANMQTKQQVEAERDVLEQENKARKDATERVKMMWVNSGESLTAGEHAALVRFAEESPEQCVHLEMETFLRGYRAYKPSAIEGLVKMFERQNAELEMHINELERVCQTSAVDSNNVIDKLSRLYEDLVSQNKRQEESEHAIIEVPKKRPGISMKKVDWV